MCEEERSCTNVNLTRLELLVEFRIWNVDSVFTRVAAVQCEVWRLERVV